MSMLLTVVGGQGAIKPCGAPGTLSLSAGGTPATQIALSWSAPSDTGGGTVSGYRIKKDGSTLVADTGSTGTTYTATGLTRVTSYNFNVAAINEAGTGADGNTPSLTTSAEVPGAPGTLSLSAGSPSQTAINLSWSAPSDTGGATITGYRIKKNGSTLVANTGTTGTTYSATGLSGNTSYNFNVAAINSVGTGTDGNTPSLTTGAFVAASGGTVTTYGNYKSHTFTSSGTLTFSTGGSVDVLIVAGGGGGHGTAGGAGAGGMQTAAPTVTATGYTITIGAGGTDNGSNSTAMSTTSTGGGKSGTAGGSGGGSFGTGASGTAGQGNDGGDGAMAGDIFEGTNNAYGGGGGKGAAGGNGSASAGGASGGNGGAGGGNTYRTGSTVTYAGGGGGMAEIQWQGSASAGSGGSGGGGAGSTSGSGTAGSANTGGGAGGGVGATAQGGSGIVVVRYQYQ
jgi:hypothetical protein